MSSLNTNLTGIKSGVYTASGTFENTITPYINIAGKALFVGGGISYIVSHFKPGIPGTEAITKLFSAAWGSAPVITLALAGFITIVLGRTKSNIKNSRDNYIETTIDRFNTIFPRVALICTLAAAFIYSGAHNSASFQFIAKKLCDATTLPFKA